MSAVLEAREPSARYLEAVRPALVRQFELMATAPGGVARLQELILSLAVQGKLVPQHLNDEPAHGALKQIQAERDRLVRAGIVKTPKRAKEVGVDELPFDIPPSWAWAQLADLVRVLNGRAYAKQELLDTGPTPVLRVGNLFTSNHWYYSNLNLDPDKLCNPGDLLFAWSASFGPFIWEGPKAIFHYHIWKLDPVAPGLFDARYFHIFLSEKTAEMKAAGHGVSMVHMTKEMMERIPVPWPPLAEQARIVARVDELMRLCDALDSKGRLEAEQHARLLGTLLGTLTDSSTPDELAANWQRVAAHFDLLLDRPEAVDALEKTILQLAVQGKLVTHDPKDEPGSVLLKRIRAERERLTFLGEKKRDKAPVELVDDDPPFALPACWAWAPLQHLGYTQTGSTPDAKTAEYFGTHMPFIKPGDIYPSYVQYDNEGLSVAGLKASSRKAPAGSSLMVCIGTIGKCAVIDRDCSFNQQINAITPIFILPTYLGCCLRSPYFQSEARARSSSTTISILNKGKWEAIPVPVPPLAEQERIVARVDELSRLCAELRKRLSAGQTTQSHLAEALVDELTA